MKDSNQHKLWYSLFELGPGSTCCCFAALAPIHSQQLVLQEILDLLNIFELVILQADGGGTSRHSAFQFNQFLQLCFQHLHGVLGLLQNIDELLKVLMPALPSQRLNESAVLSIQLNPLLIQNHNSVINLNITRIWRNFLQDTFIYLFGPTWFHPLHVVQKVANVFDENLFVLERSWFKQSENVV